MFREAEPASPSYTTGLLTPNRLRILVVGDSGVGKTLLIRRLARRLFGDADLENENVSYRSIGNAGVTVCCFPCFSLLSVLGTQHQTEVLGQEWGPTIGVVTDVLQRSCRVRSPHESSDTLCRGETGCSSPPSSLCEGGKAESLYRPYSAGLNSPPSLTYRGGNSGRGGRSREENHAAPFLLGDGGVQSVELHELGGTFAYADAALLLMDAIAYDGVLFLYRRGSAASALNLSRWYATLQEAFTGKGGLPRFMLVGTQMGDDHAASSLALLATPTAAAGSTCSRDSLSGEPPASSGREDFLASLPDDALCGGGNLYKQMDTLRSRRSNSVRSKRVGALSALARRVASFPVIFVWLLQNPFFVLSEQFQEEKGGIKGPLRVVLRLWQWSAWRTYQTEQLLLYMMAVVLFGPFQDQVVLPHKNVKATLEALRQDSLCVAQVHLCRLDCDMGLDTSLDEFNAFFDIIARPQLS